MWLTELIKNLFTESVVSGSDNTYVYQTVENTRGRMTPEEVLQKVAPIVAEENSYLNNEGTTIKPYPPTLQENAETGNRHWQVTILYERLNGKFLDENEKSECFWIIVDDDTGKVGGKIYPR